MSNRMSQQLTFADSEFSSKRRQTRKEVFGNDSNLMIVFYVQIMPDDLVMQLHRF